MGRSSYPGGPKGFKAAVTPPTNIKAYMNKYLRTIDAHGINMFKRVELNTKYRSIILIEDQDNELYKKLSREIFDAMKEEKAKREVFWKALNVEKAKVNKQALKRKLEE